MPQVEALIRSVSPEERRSPKILKGSRRTRIAPGSGRSTPAPASGRPASMPPSALRWFHPLVVRYSARVNGLIGLALTSVGTAREQIMRVYGD